LKTFRVFTAGRYSILFPSSFSSASNESPGTSLHFSGLSWQVPDSFLNPEGFGNLQGFQPLAATTAYFFLPFHLHLTKALALRFICPDCYGRSRSLFQTLKVLETFRVSTAGRYSILFPSSFSSASNGNPGTSLHFSGLSWQEPVSFLNPEGFGNLQGFNRWPLQHLISFFLFIHIQ